jgi:hypothetical protein
MTKKQKDNKTDWSFLLEFFTYWLSCKILLRYDFSLN